MVKGIGTKVFFVQTGGFDNHAGQGTNPANGERLWSKMDTTLGDMIAAAQAKKREGT